MKRSELTADDLRPLVAKLSSDEQVRLAYYALRVARGLKHKMGAVAEKEEEEELDAIRETLHLLSIPGLRESIQQGLQIPLEDCVEEPGW